jgi:hypothetical protein
MLSLRKNLKRIKTRIKSYIKLKKDQRFLKKHCCTSWKQYNRKYDTDINQYCDTVKEFYHGYNYVYCFDHVNLNHYAYKVVYDYGPGGIRYTYMDMIDWCKKNCKHKFRPDIHRVIGTNMNDYTFNDIGGLDYLFFAFKDEKDYMMFRLRWE